MRLLSLFIAISIGLSPSLSEAETRVITTSTDLADLVRQVGGEHVQVDAICKPNQDLHYVQARPSFMVKLRRADLVVSVGLDLEVGWLPLLLRGARNPRIQPGTPGYLALGTQVTPIGIPGSTDASLGHLHPRGNPHYWLDPVRVAALVPTIAERLGSLDPPHAADYAANSRALVRTLETKIGEWRDRMAPFQGTRVISYHDTYNYFYARYGLINVATLENKPGVPPSPRHLSQVIQLAKSEKIPALFHESFHDKKPSGLVASRTGATLLVLPVSVGATPSAHSYAALIGTLVDAFIEAMTERKTR